VHDVVSQFSSVHSYRFEHILTRNLLSPDAWAYV